MCYRFLAFPLSYSKHGQSVYVLLSCVFENGCACKYFLPGAACSGVVGRERERNCGYPFGCQAVFEDGRKVKQRKCSAVRKCFRLRIHEARVCERRARCEPLFYAALSSSDAVECTCVMGLGENAGWRKPRTDVSGADIEENGKKIYILLVVLAVKA